MCPGALAAFLKILCTQIVVLRIPHPGKGQSLNLLLVISFFIPPFHFNISASSSCLQSSIEISIQDSNIPKIVLPPKAYYAPPVMAPFRPLHPYHHPFEYFSVQDRAAEYLVKRRRIGEEGHERMGFGEGRN